MKIMMSVLDDDKKFVNGLTPTAIITSPDMKGTQIKLEQIAPGRYEKTVDATESGSYFVAVSPGHKSALLRTGGSVPYSPEFRDREPNEIMLRKIAKIQGNPGKLDYLDPSGVHINPFRDDLRKATSSQDIWHWFLVIACSLFFIDVFNRRVSLGTGWLKEKFALMYSKLKSSSEQDNEEYMERLRVKKEELLTMSHHPPKDIPHAKAISLLTATFLVCACLASNAVQAAFRQLMRWFPQSHESVSTKSLPDRCWQEQS